VNQAVCPAMNGRALSRQVSDEAKKSKHALKVVSADKAEGRSLVLLDFLRKIKNLPKYV
jgi:hypothetical protein